MTASGLAFISFGLSCSLHSLRTILSSLCLAILKGLLKTIREIRFHHMHRFLKKKLFILLILELLMLEIPGEFLSRLFNLNLFIL